jgi:hypothetical protein
MTPRAPQEGDDMSTTKRRASGRRFVILGTLVSLCQLTVGGRGFASSDDARPELAATQTVKAGGAAPLICNTCDPPDPPPSPRPTPRPTPTPTPRPTFTTLMSRYTPYDINGDGVQEINSLKALFPNPEPYYATPNGVVIVLVDPKLVTDEANIQMSRFEMSLWLGLLGSDISADGFFPYFVEASVYDGTLHQDGRTLLALRRFLKEVRTNYPLAGVLLVGSFPDAGIVRSVFVKANAYADNPINLTSGTAPVSGHVGHFLDLGSEYITPRAEIVLGDLDGNWEALYRPSLTVTGYSALPLEPSDAYPLEGQILVTPHFQAKPTVMYQDVFYIHDHQVTPTVYQGSLRLSIWSLEEPSPEASYSDLQRPNRIARPEILVSRIDPKRVAVMPTAPLDLDGKSPLDANGRPQRLRYSYPVDVTWQRNRSLERRLVADYVARSHSFRLGNDNGVFRTSAIRALDSGLVSPGSFNTLLRRSSDHFAPSIATDNATLEDYVEWLKQPAVLRGIAAHSNPVISQFGVSNHFDVELATGGLDFYGSHVWRWKRRQDGAEWVVEPTFSGMTQDANFHIHRTMWENGVLASVGQVFYVHEGCEVMRPSNAETLPYNSPMYGQANSTGGVANGESLMFYANGLGLMARNKVFNDMPNGFYDTVKSTGRFGFGWRAYFVTEANNSGLNERALDATVVSPGSDRRWRTLQRKRSYFWSIIGDPTLKIEY